MATLRDARALWLMVLAGVALRAVLVVLAENRLDCDESTVGVMALDVLEGRNFPFFFYGNEHNGGAALEAYLGALAFAVFGPSETALKLVLLSLWALAGFFFADLCRRTLPGLRAAVAVLCFCVGSPFLLEWSVKARGGYAETVLFTVVLLWLAARPLRLREKAGAAAFGVVAGLGVWASQMLLPLLPCAAVWLLARREPGARVRAALAMAAGAAVGLAPLVAYNWLHEGAQLREAVPALFLSRGPRPLDADQLVASLRFAFSPVTALVLAGVAVGGTRAFRAGEGAGLVRVCLVHLLLYVALYWLAGLRHLPVPPARLLYVLAPGLAVLVAGAFPLRIRPVGLHGGLAWAALALWLGLVAVPVARWAASGEPREAGSWRGSWCLVDGAGLHRRLVEEQVDAVYVARWMLWPLRFADRVAARRDPALHLAITNVVPRAGEAGGGRVALALPRDSELARTVEGRLRAAGVRHRTQAWGDFALFTGLEAARIHRGNGLPKRLQAGSWPPPPDPPDGFN